MTRWVLLRGLAREAGHWGTLPRLLARRAGGDVLTPDLPGNGLRWRERSPTRVADYVEELRSQVGGGEPAWFVAMSLGGMVALEWARLAPHEIAGCVLVNTSAGRGSAPWRRLRPANYAPLLRLPLPGLPAVERERRILAITSSKPQAHGGLLAAWVALAAAHPVSAGNAARQLWAAATYRGPASAPRVPLLLLASERDGLVHASCSDRLARRWDAPLRKHPWAGHDLPLDDPAWVVEQVAQWRHGLVARA